MKSRSFVLLFAVFVILLSIFDVTAQEKKEILTNAKIIELVNLGLGEEIIVAKIRQSDCQCQTDTASLAQLKAAKVSNAVILAMMNPSSSAPPANAGNTPPAQAPPTQGFLDQLKEPGIYVYDNGELKIIEPSVFSGTKMNPLLTGLTYGIKKTKFRAVVRGKGANMQVGSQKPEFYFVFNPDYKNSGATMSGLFWGMPASSPNEFMMVQMNVKDKTREASLGEYGVWSGMSTGASDKDIREYSFEKIKPGIYKVIPKSNLTTGEYCFYFASNVQGIGIGGGKIFDFGIGQLP